MDRNDFLLLIDGSSLLTTQFFGNLPREILFAKTPEEKEKYYHKIMMTTGGVYTNAVFGFLRTLFAILKDQRPAYIAVAWDLTRDTFRRKLYPDYKGNRSETMEPLSQQFDLCQKVLSRMNIREFMSEEFEADDWCGSVAARFEPEIPVKIFTKDHDYLQLVTERTHLWLMHTSQEKTDEMYKKYRIDHASVNVPARAFELDPALVEAEFGVKPEHVNSLKGLQGDSSDNIKGVPGVGPATAVRLIQRYGTIDQLYRAIKGLDKAGQEALKKEWKEELGITRSPLNFLLKESETELVGEKSARLSELLASIRTDIDLKGLTLQDMSSERISEEGVKEVLKELEFSSISADFFDEKPEKKDITEQFRTVSDFADFVNISETLLKEEKLGISCTPGKGLSVVTERGDGFTFEEASFITREELASFVRRLEANGTVLYTADGKGLFKYCGCTAHDTVIAAYLLNPLKSDYNEKSIESEYLMSQFIPGRFWRKSFVKARCFPCIWT